MVGGKLNMVKPQSFVRNGVMKLPPGFRFHPTDEELLVQYLKPKAFAFPLPASIIPEVNNVCKYDPWDLPGDEKEMRYLFSSGKVKYYLNNGSSNSNRCNRATGSGYWKATGLDKRIVAPRSNQVLGMKKTLVFYRGKPPNGSKTDWIMHEYRLPLVTTSTTTQNKSTVPMEDWVLCRIFSKKRIPKDDDDECSDNKVKPPPPPPPHFIDFMTQDNTNLPPPLSSSSSSTSASSGITEVSSTGSDHQESSSCCNSFSSTHCTSESSCKPY